MHTIILEAIGVVSCWLLIWALVPKEQKRHNKTRVVILTTILAPVMFVVLLGLLYLISEFGIWIWKVY
jgi:lysylphosphatidylglycerol synthetase-like protein (DUF2156 family)